MDNPRALQDSTNFMQQKSQSKEKYSYIKPLDYAELFPAKDEDSTQLIEISEKITPIKDNRTTPPVMTNNLKGEDQRMIASWSPNFEQKPNVKMGQNQIDLLKRLVAEARAEQENRPAGMKIIGMNEEADSLQKEKPVLVVKPQRGPTKQVTNRNYMFEDQLKTLSENMLEILEEKPDPGQDLSELIPPTGMKVTLLPHQMYSMIWLKWREQTFPHGSILADDMGLGKTLTILAYLKLVKDGNQKDKRLKTLVILPASLLHQWQGEIKSKFESNTFKIHVYHEGNRRRNSYNMEDNDLVFTTYEIVARECETITDENDNEISPDSPLSNIKWKRIILDEAHRIKNYKTKCSKAICALEAKFRIAITGTPIHNSLTDLYSLIKFLHLEPLNDLKLWKYTFETDKKTNPDKKPTANAIQRSKRTDSWITFLSDYLMLRRTKQDKFKGTEKKIVELPEKKFEIVKFALGPKEKIIYDKIFKQSQDKVKDFLKNQRNRLRGKDVDTGATSYMGILLILLRLRQTCCHTSLLAKCLDVEELRKQKMESDGLDGMLENLKLEGALQTETNDTSADSSFKDNIETLDNIKSDDDLTVCLNEDFSSAKLQMLIEMVERHLKEDPDDKMIIVSQWTSVLAIVAKRLQSLQIEYCEVKGDVKLYERNQVQVQFNDSNNKSLRVMLLSLTAGGVGLNLVGANRMFLLDIHWNPALEQQCSDRIYRVGQKKPVTIYKFLCEQTIEERIQTIQEIKVELANKVYGQSGTGATNAKLTVQDFKLLFTAFAQPPPEANPDQQ